MTKILTITGWAQDSKIINDALDLKADHLDYLDKQKITVRKKYDMVIGWSLGGQIALDLALKLDIEKIVLIATPYKFIDNYNGVSELNFLELIQELKDNKNKLLRNFMQLIAYKDSNHRDVMGSLKITKYKMTNLLYWLQQLHDFSAEKFLSQHKKELKNKKILLIYGTKDYIVPFKQGKLYLDNLSKSKLELINGASHAPFLHDKERVKKLINDFCRETKNSK